MCTYMNICIHNTIHNDCTVKQVYVYPTLLVKLFTLVNLAEAFSQVTHSAVSIDEVLKLGTGDTAIMIRFLLSKCLHSRQRNTHLSTIQRTSRKLTQWRVTNKRYRETEERVFGGSDCNSSVLKEGIKASLE